MLARFKQSRPFLSLLGLGLVAILFFQNCNQLESLQVGSLQLSSNSSGISQKGEGYLNYCAADKAPVLDGVQISVSGAQETVWTSPNPNNLAGPIPDGTTTAYRDAQGKVSLLIVHSDTFRITGDSLNNLNPNSTEVIFRSKNDTQETAYNHRHWLMAPYSLDGNNFVGVNHHEWYACTVNNDCNNDYQVILRSWANSLTKTVSNDGGRTWSVPESHLILAPPLWNNKPYKTAAVNNHGFFHPTKIVREGNYFYLFAFAATSRDLPAAQSYQGMIILRTSDFDKWQYWTGGARYVDVGAEKPAVIPDMDTVLVSLTYNASLCSYMAVFSTGNADRGTSALYYKLTRSLANPQWTAAKEISGTRQVIIPDNAYTGGFIVNNYPSVLDPLSAGYNFEISGSSPYVYFNNIGPDAYVRNVYRLPLKIEGAGVIVSRPPEGSGGATPVPTPTPTPTPVTPQPTPLGARIAAGLFALGEGIYYSNGSDYCYFSSMNSFTQITGRTSQAGISQVTGIPSGMNNHGACQGSQIPAGLRAAPTAGLFMMGSGIYYSNGSGYCFFPTFSAFTANTGRSNSDGIIRLSELPAGQTNDGACH